jgi:beta-glucosidase
LNSLAGFRRVKLASRQTRTLSVSIPAERMLLVGEDGQSRLEVGKFRLTVGSCSPGGRGQQLGAAPALVSEFEVI